MNEDVVILSGARLCREGRIPIEMLDALTGVLTDTFEQIHMGETAENVAAKYDVSRADQGIALIIERL